MNKKMRELLADIEAKSALAKGYLEANDSEKLKAAMAEIDNLKEQYEAAKKLYETEKLRVGEPEQPPAGQDDCTKAFLGYLRGTEKSLSMGSNGAIVPTTIASKIVEQISELSPIYAKATKYNVKGKLSIPVYGADNGDQITAAYGTEFTDLTSHAGKFTSVDLESNMIGALTKISNYLINNTDVDVLSFIVGKIAKADADFIEKEMLIGTGAAGHMTGATTTTNVMTLTTKTIAGVNADVLIELQLSVPEVYQRDACWIMNKDLFVGIRKLKDGSGRYLCSENYANGFGWMLLGKPVYISDNMPAVAASSVPLIYGDMSGMAVKLSKDVEVKVLNELYATQNAVGVVGWVEADSKIENSQKFKALKMSE